MAYNPQAANTFVYAGNPNGNMAGNASSGTLPPDFCYDVTNGILYVCTTTGNAAGAVWSNSSAGANLDNFLPNPQWQLWSAVVYGRNPITKQKSDGTGSQNSISCSAFSTANAGPAFTTSNTQQLKVGDIVQIAGGGFQWGFAGVGYVSTSTGVRVNSVTPNAAFSAIGPLGGAGVTPTASVAVNAIPVSAGDLGTVTYGPDGWTKTQTLNIWADDFSVNSCPGAIRTLGIRKGSVFTETLTWTCASNQFAKFRGRQVTFGVIVYQKVQSGAGTWRAYINDNVTGSTYSSNGAGVSYTDPTYGGFQFLSVTATVSASATSFSVGVQFNGASSDVYYVALPTGVLGSFLSRSNCRQNVNDVLRSTAHWNPPLLTPLAMTFPATTFSGAGSLYGWSGIDIQAMSFDTVDKSVAMLKCKIEFISPTVGASLFSGDELPDPLIFGPQVATQISSSLNVGQGWLPLKNDGTFTLFTGQQSLVISNATFDFDVVQLSMPASASSTS